MSRFASDVLLGEGVRVRVRVQRKFKGKVKGTTKPLNLDIPEQKFRSPKSEAIVS